LGENRRKLRCPEKQTGGEGKQALPRHHYFSKKSKKTKLAKEAQDLREKKRRKVVTVKGKKRGAYRPKSEGTTPTATTGGRFLVKVYEDEPVEGRQSGEFSVN